MAGGGRGSRRRGRIYRRRGASKPSARGEGNSDIVVKLGSRSCSDGICIRGYHIRQVGRMKVDANGDAYVPDSEDEESSMEVEAGGVEMTDFGGAADGAQMAVVGVPAEAIAVGTDRVAEDGLDVVAESVPADAIEVAADADATDGVKFAANVAGSSEEMHPEVATCLKMLLAHMDPTFHDVFVSMYKTTKIMKGHTTT